MAGEITTTNHSQQGDYSGDHPELEKFLERHLSWIQSFVHRKLSTLIRRKAETGDIVQDAVVQFLRHGPRIQLSNDRQFRALLAKIVENVLRDKYDWFTAHRRAIARERPLPPDMVLNLDPSEGIVDSPSQIVQRHEQEAWVRLGLELLQPEERRIIILRDWEDLSFTEIGKKTGSTKGTTRRKYLQSIERLIGKINALKSRDIDQALGLQSD